MRLDWAQRGCYRRTIIPDAIEWDEYQTGVRHGGTFYGLITLFGKIANSVAVPLSPAAQFTGYVPNAVNGLAL